MNTLAHIINLQQFWMLTIVICNWHMPINEMNDSDSASVRKGEEKERKLPNEQKKIRFFLDCIGKLYNFDEFIAFALNCIEHTQVSFTISATFCTVVLWLLSLKSNRTPSDVTLRPLI